jgi:hypothetical protein
VALADGDDGVVAERVHDGRDGRDRARRGSSAGAVGGRAGRPVAAEQHGPTGHEEGERRDAAGDERDPRSAPDVPPRCRHVGIPTRAAKGAVRVL